MAGGGNKPGSGKPSNVAKVPILKRIDDLSKDPGRRDALLHDLESSNEDYVAIMKKHGVIQAKSEEDHMVDHWFNQWWPDHQPVEPIVRQSLIVALREAKERNLPMDNYWMMSDDDRFEVVVCWSDAQITRMIRTPTVSGDLISNLLIQDQPIVVVKRFVLGEEEVDRQVSTGIVTVRLKTYSY